MLRDHVATEHPEGTDISTHYAINLDHHHVWVPHEATGGQSGVTKSDYVKGQKQDRRHGCHWPDCPIQVPPAMWGCKTHWFQLPKNLRDKIWAEYVPGQERRMDPSDDYLAVAFEVQAWIKENHTA